MLGTYTAKEFFERGTGIVTLCGSTRYFEECMKLNRELTFQGWIVLQCGSWGHSYHKELDSGLSKEEYKRVKELHFKKILLSQVIVVVSDATGYYGESTTSEIAFAEAEGIPIFYYDGERLTGETLELPLDNLKQLDLIIEGIQYRKNLVWEYDRNTERKFLKINRYSEGEQQ